MSTLGDRLKEIRQYFDESQQKFSDRVGIHRTYISDVEADRKEPSYSFLKKLIDSININPAWLMTGVGEKFISIASENQGHSINIDTLINNSVAKLENGIFCSKSTVYVPVSSITACCGSGITIYPQDYDINEAIAVNRREVGSLVEGLTPFAVYTQGRSMEGYGIKEGSLVVVNPAEQWTTGTVVMAAIDEKASIKKVYMRGDGIDLASSSGDRLHISNDELRQGDYVRICGKVMLVIAPPEHGV
mgnify:FL=1